MSGIRAPLGRVLADDREFAAAAALRFFWAAERPERELLATIETGNYRGLKSSSKKVDL